MKSAFGIFALTSALLLGLAAPTAQAQTLTIATATTPSVDPHFLFLTSNVAYAKHVFSTLTRVEGAKVVPELALSWRAIGPQEWEFKLRPNVKFHDGSVLSADDVAFSIARISKVPNNPISYANYVGSITETKVLDPLTLRVLTAAPEPLLPMRIATVFIVSKKVAESATTADFNTGRAAVGTGPFRFSAYVPGERYELVRNEDYFGPKPAWQKVVFRIITQDSSRIAALLSGEVDLIESVPPADAAKLRENQNVAVQTAPSLRFFFMFFNLFQDSNPFITDAKGAPLGKNPFKDLRVREAFSLAIDRKAIVDRVFDGAAVVINQIATPDMPAFNTTSPAIPYDLPKAKKLLADAGYPDGFGLTVHCSNDRYPNDGRVCQTVGQMLARLGLTIKVETQPKAIFFSKVFPPKSEYAFGLLGWGDPTGDASGGLNGFARSYDAAKKAGVYNVSGYSNPEVDKQLDLLSAEPNVDKRHDIERALHATLAKDLPYVALYGGSVVTASKRSIAYKPRADEWMLAMDATPAK